MAINTNPSSRRALLAAAAGGTVALVAESLARPLPARASDTEYVVLGGVNNSRLTTTLRNEAGYETGHETVLLAKSFSGSAIGAHSDSGSAIDAVSNTGVGLMAVSKQHVGIVGYCGNVVPGGSDGGENTTGVMGGSGAGTGVYGMVKSGTGVAGTSESGTGVAGTSESGAGVAGTSETGSGVYAKSITGRGVVAESSSIGIEGHTNGTTTEEAMFGANVIGVWGTVDGPGGFGIAVKGDGANGCGVIGQGGHCGVHGYSEKAGVEGKSLTGTGVSGQTNDGVAVHGGVFTGGSGVALQTDGPVIFSSAGRGDLVGGRAKVTPGVALDSSSKVLITLMGNPGAQALVPYAEVTPGPAGTGFFRVRAPGARVTAVPFAYFVIS